MKYSVKANSIVKDVVIHRHPCGQIRKRGGSPGKYGPVFWEDFGTLDDAQDYAKQWQKRGYVLKYCSFCAKELRT